MGCCLSMKEKIKISEVLSGKELYIAQFVAAT